MRQHVIILEQRKPTTKEERYCDGISLMHGRYLSNVYINCMRDREANIDTFFHELTHVYFNWRGYKTRRFEEQVCKDVAKAATKAFKKSLRK